MDTLRSQFWKRYLTSIAVCLLLAGVTWYYSAELVYAMGLYFVSQLAYSQYLINAFVNKP